MSITFTTPALTTGKIEVRCGCRYDDETPQLVFATYTQYKQWRTIYNQNPHPLPGCSDEMCLAYGPIPSTQTADSHAEDVLTALGIVDDEGHAITAGTLPADDFAGRILVALALKPISAPRAAVNLGTEGGTTIIDRARAEGYVQLRLEQLRTLAAYSREHGLPVVWG